MSALRIALELAASQGGVISVDQAIQAGLARSTMRGIVRRQGWRRLHRGVYLLPGAEWGFRQECQAALLAAGPKSVLCRRTVAHIFGLLPKPPFIEVFLPLSERAPALAPVRVCRTGTLRPADLAEMDGLRVTTPTRTVIDLAAVLQPPELRAVLIEAQQKRLITLDRVDRRIDGLGPVRGIGVVRRLVWELHPERCDSILEHRVRALIRGAGLPTPAPQPWPVPAGGRSLRIDIAWPAKRLGLEVDGLAYHSGHADLDRDHRRGNALVLAGWRILRVGWHRVEIDAEGFLADLRAGLA